jgi:hypothetical protein
MIQIKNIEVHLSVVSALLALMVCSGVSAAQEGGVETLTAATAQIAQGLATNQPLIVAQSPGASEIVKMVDAGVSTEVIKAYIECSPTAWQPTDADVIALKKHNVPDEVATLLLKRGAQARTAVARAKQDAVARAMSARRMASGGLDPESYDYFQYYYLQPRAMASAYERLSPYYYPWFPYRYGYHSMAAFDRSLYNRPIYPR